MKTIAKRLYTAQRFFHEKDYETALIFIAIAVDGTAKEKYPKLNGYSNVGKRIKKFINEYHDFIIQIVSGGKMIGFDGKKAKLILSGQELKDLIYSVRNALIHADKKLKVSIIPNSGIMGRNIMTYDHIHALFFAVIMDEINKDCVFEKNLEWTINDEKVLLNDLWGNSNKVKSLFKIVKE